MSSTKCSTVQLFCCTCCTVLRVMLRIVSKQQHSCANLCCKLSCSLHAACRMHNAAVAELLQMLRIVVVVLYTCVFAPNCYSIIVTQFVQNCNQNVVQCGCSNCTKKGLHSLPAALSHAAHYALLLHVQPNPYS